MLDNTFAIGKLLLQSSSSDHLALKQQIESQLDADELTPSNLSPSAILIVKRIHDPMPRTLQRAAHGIKANKSWSQAVREKLEHELVNAGRPAKYCVPDTANAVLFNDRAELVASLAMDISLGQRSSHWWWKNIATTFPELIQSQAPLSTQDLLYSLLADRTELLPSVFTCLQQRQMAVNVITLLTVESCEDLLNRLAAIFELSRKIISYNHANNKRTLPACSSNKIYDYSATKNRPLSDLDNLYEPDKQKHSLTLQEPWADWLPPRIVHTPLSPQHRCLLGICLGLHKKPFQIRHQQFSERAHQWWQYQSSSGNLSWWNEIDIPAQVTDSNLSTQVEKTHDLVDTSPSPTDTITPNDIHHTAASQSANDHLDQPLPPEIPSFVERNQTELFVANPFDNHETLQPSATDTKKVPADQSSLGEGVEIQTQLGGILYLINALESLGIPDSFNSQWNLVSDLGAWGILRLLAEKLLGEHFVDSQKDAIWPLLDSLSGNGSYLKGNKRPLKKPKEAIIKHLWSYSTPNFSAPLVWQTMLLNSPQRLLWTVAYDRVWLWSANGFLLAAVKRNSKPPREQAQDELQRWSSLTTVTLQRAKIVDLPLAGGPTVTADASVEAWLGAVLLAVRHRLAMALDNNTQQSIIDLVSINAQIFASTTHIDLVTDIDSIWLPARIAGLDRSPGWQTGYSRVILFHYR